MKNAGMHLLRIGALVLVGALLFTGCAPKPAGATGTEIISAHEALSLVRQSGVVLVDARPTLDYRESRLPGAVGISRADIVTNTPFANMLADSVQIEQVMSNRGIGNETLVVIYDDNNNMDYARLWWTLKVYGHHNVKVVSGGLKALVAAGATLTTETVTPTPTHFTASPADQSMLISAVDIRNAINNDDRQIVLVDTRSAEEIAEHGTIPGSLMIDYRENNFRDGTFRPVQQIQILYLGAGIDYGKTAVLYCQTSIRGAETFLAMYNAGFRNLRLFDGAWVEWAANPMNPIQRLESAGPLRAADAS